MAITFSPQPARASRARGAGVTAVLGPTNTGKTHLAIERMLGHRTGMIGFPLRLLARENYDRVVRLKGTRAVALITGEEKIVPPSPSYFVCTVESMPLDLPVEFLAVDEIVRRHGGPVSDMIGGGWLSLRPGQVTDDTDMACALARSIVERGGYEPEAALSHYLSWFETDPLARGEVLGPAPNA